MAVYPRTHPPISAHLIRTRLSIPRRTYVFLVKVKRPGKKIMVIFEKTNAVSKTTRGVLERVISLADR